jgi:hypothetical protein
MSSQKAGPPLAVTISFMPIPSPTFYYSYLRQKKTLPNQPPTEQGKIIAGWAGMAEQDRLWIDAYWNKAAGKKFHLSTLHTKN